MRSRRSSIIPDFKPEEIKCARIVKIDVEGAENRQ